MVLPDRGLISIRQSTKKIINISGDFIPTKDLLIYLKSLWKSQSDGIFKSSNIDWKNFNYFDISWAIGFGNVYIYIYLH